MLQFIQFSFSSDFVFLITYFGVVLVLFPPTYLFCSVDKEKSEEQIELNPQPPEPVNISTGTIPNYVKRNHSSNFRHVKVRELFGHVIFSTKPSKHMCF